MRITKETNYSKDKNLWHLSHEGLDLEDPSLEPSYEKPGFLEEGVSPIDAPDEPTYISLTFAKGLPVALNGQQLTPKEIVLALNQLGGENGIGILDLVEDRLVGMKSRGVYETPGGTILYFAHEYLETLTLDKEVQHEKAKLAITYGELVYDGKWFTPLKAALDAFVDQTQEAVNGTVKLKLYKGNIIKAGASSEDSLYSPELATFDASDYDQAEAGGFIDLFGLPISVQARLDAKKGNK